MVYPAECQQVSTMSAKKRTHLWLGLSPTTRQGTGVYCDSSENKSADPFSKKGGRTGRVVGT